MRILITLMVLCFFFSATAQTGSKPASNTDSVAFARLLFSNQFRTDTIAAKDLPGFKEDLYKLNIYSATVVFSGTRFSNIALGQVSGGLQSISPLLERCVSGTKISFEKLRLKNKDNLPGQVINKSFFIK